MNSQKIVEMLNNKKKVINYVIQGFILLIVMKYFYDMIKPIVVIAQYSHPTMDDYWMTAYVHERWQLNYSGVVYFS